MEGTVASQSPNEPVKQRLYGDTRENKSGTFHSFIINLPSLLCRDVLLLGVPCFRAGPAPATPPEMLDVYPEPELCGFMGFIFAVHSQAQLFSASSDSSWAPALSLSILCMLKVIK